MYEYFSFCRRGDDFFLLDLLAEFVSLDFSIFPPPPTFLISHFDSRKSIRGLNRISHPITSYKIQVNMEPSPQSQPSNLHQKPNSIFIMNEESSSMLLPRHTRRPASSKSSNATTAEEQTDNEKTIPFLR